VATLAVGDVVTVVLITVGLKLGLLDGAKVGGLIDGLLVVVGDKVVVVFLLGLKEG
jgi:hypothetical protein